MSIKKTWAASCAVPVIAISALAPQLSSADTFVTPWKGWTVNGPSPAVSRPGSIASNNGLTAVVNNGSSRDDRGSIILRKGDSQAYILAPEFGYSWQAVGVTPAGKVLVASGGCSVATTPDEGKTWDASKLPGCSNMWEPQNERVFSFSSASSGFFTDVAKSDTWFTNDGGKSWKPYSHMVTKAFDGGATSPVISIENDRAIRTVVSSQKATVEITDGSDGNVWRTVKLPDATGVDQSAIAGSLSTPVIRKDGKVLIGAADAVYVSSDKGATFARVALPAMSTLPNQPSYNVESLVCDANSKCLARVTANAKAVGRVFSGTSWGSEQAAPPSLSVSPAANVIEGIHRSSGKDNTLVKSTDFGSTYKELQNGEEASANLGGHGLIAVQKSDVLWLSSNQGKDWSTVSTPNDKDLKSVALIDASTQAVITSDNKVWVRKDGKWAQWADVSNLQPEAITSSGGKLFVAGVRGIAEVTNGNFQSLSAPALDGRSINRLAANGNNIAALSFGRVIVSKDLGKTWKVSKLKSVRDVQVLKNNVVMALTKKGAIYRSISSGSKFKRRGYCLIEPSVSENYRDSMVTPSAIEFADSSRGMLYSSGDGVSVTRNGGKSCAPVPLPAGTYAQYAAFSGNGISVQRKSRGEFFFAPNLFTEGVKTTLSARKVSSKGSSVTLTGRLSGAPAADVFYPQIQKTKAGQPYGEVSGKGNADGTYRRSVSLRRSRYVSIWYVGFVGADKTYLSSRSQLIKR